MKVERIGFAALAIAMSTLFIPAVLQAQPIVVEGEQAPTAIVSYADLDLASAGDVRTLRNRVRWAANDLCLTTAFTPLKEQMVRIGCRDGAVARAEGQISDAITGRAASMAAAAQIVVTLR